MKDMKWEYKKIEADRAYHNYQISAEALNVLGEDGWELCGIINNVYYFKRQINEP